MEESTKIGILALVGLSLLGIGAYVFRKKLFNTNTHILSDEFSPKEVETLTMKEVVTYFKDQKLNPKVHTPFIANNLSKFSPYIPKKEGFKTIIAGVYNETEDDFKPLRVYHCIRLSADVIEIMGNEELIVLS
jgi:hypothetical protein